MQVTQTQQGEQLNRLDEKIEAFSETVDELDARSLRTAVLLESDIAPKVTGEIFMKEITRAALYLRVSGQEQAIRGLSMEAQREDLEEYARSQGWVIVGVYIDRKATVV